MGDAGSAVSSFFMPAKEAPKAIGKATGLIDEMTKAPTIPAAAKVPLPTPPTMDNTQAQLAAAASTQQQKRKRASTILTSPRGVLDQAPVAVKQLLGQ